MKIEIKKLRLQNFKGARDLTVEFSDRTEIRGMNASGKTRVFDAFTFLLHGKDSDDKKDFNIKCLDKNNEPLHRVDTSVTGLLSVNGRDMKLERIYKEKWVKKRGEETPEFAGHETLFYVNNVPHSMKEYQEKIEGILPESLFKQVTNPIFFNSMKWTERREMLFKMAGQITDQDVIAVNSDLKAFYESITGKTFEEFKKELAAKKKLLKESMQNIPARIDEVSRAIIPDPDYEQVQADIDKYSARITRIDELMASDAEKYNVANQQNQDRQNRVYELRRKINELYANDKMKAESEGQELAHKKTLLENSISNLKSDIAGLNSTLNLLKKHKADIESENDLLRKEWIVINESALIFNEDEFICPACKRPFEVDDIEAKKIEMAASFNSSKTTKLEKIAGEGMTNAAEIKRTEAEITSLVTKITACEVNIEAKQKEFDTLPEAKPAKIPLNPEITRMQDEIKQLEAAQIVVVANDNSELIREKAEINKALDELKKALNIKEQNEKLLSRKTELIASEKLLAQQIADIEKQEFQCDAFTWAKISMIEDKVNSMFTLVKFKMFNGLINGGTEEVCEALVDGVPYIDANSAAKIQSGLDIIRTLSKHYDVYAPVFIDNRESTTEIPDMDCQVISLYVDPAKKELEVVNN